VILLDGIGYDLPRFIEALESISLPLYVIPFGSDPDGWVDASPATHVSSGKGIPAFMLIFVEGSNSTQQDAELLAEQLSKAGVSTILVEAFNKTHSSLNKDIGLAGDGITSEIMAFISN